MKKHNIAAIVALLLLAFTASYGVYTFQLLFVPWWIAFISAASFEATYIGLALAELTQASKKRAMIISLAAVAVSITYNSLSAFFQLSPEMLNERYVVLNGVLAVLHGLPLALVAYFVADLIIHRPNIASKPTSKTESKVSSKPQANIEAKPVLAMEAKQEANRIATSKATVKAKGRFVCDQCGYKASNQRALNGHMSKHRNEKNV